MAYQYNPQGAANGLFAPAYIPGNPQSVDAVAAWNATNRPPVGTPPAGTPPAGMPPGPVVEGPGFRPGASIPGLRQGALFPGRPPVMPAGGGAPGGMLPGASPIFNQRNQIAQALMARRGGFGGV